MFGVVGLLVGIVVALRIVAPAIRSHYEGKRHDSSIHSRVVWSYEFATAMALGVALGVTCCGVVGHLIDIALGTTKTGFERADSARANNASLAIERGLAPIHRCVDRVRDNEVGASATELLIRAWLGGSGGSVRDRSVAGRTVVVKM